MKILYTSPSCAYCHTVIDYAKENGITLDVRNIVACGIMDEMLARGGKMQVPYLYDEETETGLYESGEIMQYLEKCLPESIEEKPA